ncbi:hypothetical protein [Caballeronia zhejiangensis]|uniref:hypothetical protein n=1 Tax=Caballeronia zhejiangensis TaxID=871203 RepID=UPI001F527C44|nr:hypothetical protein [Caballeronia zhejiangensis]MCI1047054.1 hypothetical protein [Caballeronia zhejiangensis]
MEHRNFRYPLTADERAVVEELLVAGNPLKLGDVSLYPDDRVDVIWGVDAFGQDCIASNTGKDVESALRWVDRQHAPDFLHPAENGGTPCP